MTQKELSQIRYLKTEIEQDAERLQEFEKHSISGLFYEEKLSPETAAIIEQCKRILDAKRKKNIEEYARLCRYIEGIEDDFMRQIIVLRYINGYNWVQVAMNIGGGNTAEGVRIAHKRFLKAEERQRRKKKSRFE